MPLFADGSKKIRRNLKIAESGQRPALVRIGFFTADQLEQINAARIAQGRLPLKAEIVFHGGHLYRSRCLKDGYSIEEVLLQVQSVFEDGSEVCFSATSSVLRNPKARTDARGRSVNDEAVFECTARYPYAELYSVIPRGDGKRG